MVLPELNYLLLLLLNCVEVTIDNSILNVRSQCQVKSSLQEIFLIDSREYKINTTFFNVYLFACLTKLLLSFTVYSTCIKILKRIYEYIYK